MNSQTLRSFLKGRLGLIAMVIFLWGTGSLILHSLMKSNESEQLLEDLKISQSLVMDRLQVLQMEVGQKLSAEMARAAAETQESQVFKLDTSNFVAVALVKAEGRKFVLQRLFHNGKSEDLNPALVQAQLDSLGSVERNEESKAFLWVDQHFFGLFPFSLPDGTSAWGLAVNALPTPWLKFPGVPHLFLIDQRSENVISAFGGTHQARDMKIDFKEITSEKVAAVKLRSKESTAWVELPGTNLTLVLQHERTSPLKAFVIWGVLSLMFVAGAVIGTSTPPRPAPGLQAWAPQRDLLEAKEEVVSPETFVAADVPSVSDEEQNLEEMEPLRLENKMKKKNEKAASSDFIFKPQLPTETMIEDQLLETVFLPQKDKNAPRVLDGVTEVLESMAGEIQNAGARVNLMIPDTLTSDWPQTQLRTVLEEVIRNSLEAMESADTKTLTFTTSDLGERIQLCVEDTGLGMTDEVLARCLEAFFSTKPSLSKRRGLGLNVAKRLLEISKGSLRIESTPAVGTKVFLTFLKEGHEQEISSVQHLEG